MDAPSFPSPGKIIIVIYLDNFHYSVSVLIRFCEIEASYLHFYDKSYAINVILHWSLQYSFSFKTSRPKESR